MTALALYLALIAACFHALWNALIRGSTDRLTTIAGISAAHGVVGLLGVLLLPLPDLQSWPYILASILIHYGYYYCIHIAYRYGDLSQIYPVSRGMAPILVTLGAQFFAGENLPLWAWAGILSVSAGIGILSLGNFRANRKALRSAMGIGLLISAYSVVDGIGVRLAGAPFSYIAWLFLGEIAVPIFLVLFFWQGRTHRAWGAAGAAGLFGGILSLSAYAMVIYAKSFTAIGAVSAIRESSVVLAALIGVFWFGEKPKTMRIISALIVAGGVVLLALSL